MKHSLNIFQFQFGQHMKKFQINPAYEARAYWIIITMVTLVFLFSIGMNAQVVRKGNTFIEQKSDSSRGNATKTQYLYTDSKGVTDTVYLSKNGSAFVWKVSKKTGKKYRKYLPAVTEQLGTKKDKK